MANTDKFKYFDNDSPDEHEKASHKEYLFGLLPFVLLIFLALTAFVLLI